MFISLGAFAMGMTSCLKDKNVEDQKYGMIGVNAFKVVALPVTSNTLGLVKENKVSVVNFAAVTLQAENVADQDIKVNLSIDPTDAAITAYNAANTTQVSKFPSNKYTLPEGLTVTIPKGSRTGYLKLSVNAQDLSISSPYALAFKIASADAGYSVSGNNNSTFVLISAKNSYDGNYSADGSLTFPPSQAGSNRSWVHREKTLTTIDETTSRVEAADLGTSNYYMYLKVNADNTVTVTPAPGAATNTIQNDGACTYNPTTKTFSLNYKYVGGTGDRKIKETLTLVP